VRAHLLSWALGPAFFGAVFAAHGGESFPDPPGKWPGLLGALGGLALFLAGFGLAQAALMVVVQRLNEGRNDWAEVRRMAAAMAVKVALLGYVLGSLMTLHVLAAVVLGGWKGGWLAALVGAGVGAAFGLPSGLAVAWLRIPRRLGLDRIPPASP
jgi:hypothetical protein